MGAGYLNFQLKGKQQTTKDDIGGGQVDLPALSPGLFLELQTVKLHDHEGANSRPLRAAATPEMVRGYQPQEREEHGTATWSGGASASGSIALTFANQFREAPNVFVTARGGNANIIVGIGAPTVNGVTIYWKDDTAATHTSLDFSWIAKGR